MQMCIEMPHISHKCLKSLVPIENFKTVFRTYMTYVKINGLLQSRSSEDAGQWLDPGSTVKIETS